MLCREARQLLRVVRRSRDIMTGYGLALAIDKRHWAFRGPDIQTLVQSWWVVSVMARRMCDAAPHITIVSAIIYQLRTLVHQQCAREVRCGMRLRWISGLWRVTPVLVSPTTYNGQSACLSKPIAQQERGRQILYSGSDKFGGEEGGALHSSTAGKTHLLALFCIVWI